MTVIVDTSVLVGFLNVKDSAHARAKGIMDQVREGAHGAAVGLDVVLDEGLTFLRAKFPARAVAEEYANWFWGTRRERPMLRLLTTDEARLREATDTYFRIHKRGLSLTDCVILAHARHLGARVASLDGGFDGLVESVAG